MPWSSFSEGWAFSESCSSSLFNYLRNLHMVFHSDCTNLHFYRVYKGFLFSTYSPGVVICCPFLYEPFHQAWGDTSLWLWFAFAWCVMLSTFSCAWWSFMSLEKCLFRSSAHVLLGLFGFWYCVVWLLCVFCILTSYQIQSLQISSLIQ